MTGQMLRAAESLELAAIALYDARIAHNAATRNYLLALAVADGDDARVAAAIKRAVEHTGREYECAEHAKARAAAAFRAFRK